MSKSRFFACSGVKLPANASHEENGQLVRLATQGKDANVNIELADVAKVLNKDATPRLVDFLEIAAYVYAADASTTREGAWTDDYTTESWERDFRFAIPVRDLDFWNSQDIKESLCEALNFLSDDNYEFEFSPLKEKTPRQSYFEFGPSEHWPFQDVDRVFMFSGGLDSLAGAVQAAAAGEKLVLVSHRSVTKTSTKQIGLFEQLRKRFSVPMIHVPVWANKDKKLGREHTQRTRSFLFSVLGTVVAESVHAKGVSFFENGVVSLNLPIADEVVRARASRTTHPYALILLQRLCELLTGRPFVIDNPFLFMTKKEVVSVIAEHGASELIPYTVSCAHTGFFSSKTQWHCGACSQCIDRRIATLACGLEAFDSETDYRVDVFTGPRKDNYEYNMAANYVRHAVELTQMSEDQVGIKFNSELIRAARGRPRRSAVADEFVKLHKRHGDTVRAVIEQQIRNNAKRFLDEDLQPSSMLSIITGRVFAESSWVSYANRIAKLLSDGLPVACESHKPSNEKHLQQICDGILRSNDYLLVREFPFMQWSSVLTKPDWSIEPLRLWVELKYVREKKDINPITEAIAADITKYGDNKRRVLFVVYDPNHRVIDDAEFSKQIITRPEMRVHFIR